MTGDLAVPESNAARVNIWYGPHQNFRYQY